MRGHIRQRGKASWELRVHAGRDPLTGRPKYVTRTVRGGKREAQKALASLVVEVEQVGAAASGTFADLVERWFEQRRADWSPSNVRETRRIIDTKLRPLLELRLDRVTTAAIDRFYAGLRGQGGADGGPLGAASVQRIHTVVRAALEQGVAWGWIARNPAAHARPGRVDTVEVAPPRTPGRRATARSRRTRRPRLRLLLDPRRRYRRPAR